MGTHPVMLGNGRAIDLDDAVVQHFAANLRGLLITPADATYAEARQLYNGMIDKRPG